MNFKEHGKKLFLSGLSYFPDYFFLIIFLKWLIAGVVSALRVGADVFLNVARQPYLYRL